MYTSVIMLVFLKSTADNSKRVQTWDKVLKGLDTSGCEQELSFFGMSSSEKSMAGEDSARD